MEGKEMHCMNMCLMMNQAGSMNYGLSEGDDHVGQGDVMRIFFTKYLKKTRTNKYRCHAIPLLKRREKVESCSFT